MAENGLTNLIATLQSGIFHLDPPERIKTVADIAAIIDGYQTRLLQQDDFRELLILCATPEVRKEVAAAVQPDAFFQLGTGLVSSSDIAAIEAYFELFRCPEFLRRIYDDPRWADLILQLVRQANYTFPKLFRHRAELYPEKILFTVLDGERQMDYNWQEIAGRVADIARGLLAAQDSDQPGQVAFLCENSLDMALFDLACLTSGQINLMIPANSVTAHVEYILNKTQPTLMVVSNDEQLDKIRNILSSFPSLKKIIMLREPRAQEKNLLTIDGLLKLKDKIPTEVLEKRQADLKVDDLLTMMFTSGTTGNPKGIMFSHQNIVYKRFARAMAIPEIGDEDRFLSYLPLFHTFGRWLEMTGSIFWNARYVFMENPSPDTMIENMRRMQPTIFISIPKKWYQLYERVGQEVDFLKSTDEEILAAVNSVTGGKLRWGLSAAGHLDSEVFQFFQRNGIELMSGFGMTEATGGITMTPPGRYRPNSLGKALPGIEIKLGDDGELLIRGPYVMLGYFNPDAAGSEWEDGWLPTGDIMRRDDENFIEIIDRKKEIYKNVKGETIAPQRIENFFREFEFIKHVYLVGDHKPYNTLLIYPNHESTEVDLAAMDAGEEREYFSSVVVSVNRFLAAFERIVDFTIIDRDFDAEKGELTPKGTYRRRVVETNFKSFIDPMYERNYTSVVISGHEVRIPNWFLRERGLTANEVSTRENILMLRDWSFTLSFAFENDLVRVGNLNYRTGSRYLDLGKILVQPRLWIGNEEVINFAGENIFRWSRLEEEDSEISYAGIAIAVEPQQEERAQLQNLLYKREKSLIGVHLATLMLFSQQTELGVEAVNYLEIVARQQKMLIAPLAMEILEHSAGAAPIDTQRVSLHSLLSIVPQENFSAVVRKFLAVDPYFINPDLIAEICKTTLKLDQMRELFVIAEDFCRADDPSAVPLFTLLSRYGSRHPTRFKLIREFLVGCQMSRYSDTIRAAARKARLDLRAGFRDWLGETQQVAVDNETGEEYTWDDVIIVEESIEPEDRDRLLTAIRETTIIREAIFLFSAGVLIRLNDIPPGGVWISFLGSHYGKAVYRCSVQTRFQGSFDIAINVNHSLEKEVILQEINWLIKAGTARGGTKLVEDYGGYWEDFDLWSEEFIPGETADRYILRHGRQKDPTKQDRIRGLWPFFIWSGITAYVDFWQRSERQMELLDPSPQNIIIPVHDYQTGSRIVSIAARREHKSPLDMLVSFHTHFVELTEQEYPLLEGYGKWKFIFSPFLEVLGQTEGLKVLQECLDESRKSSEYAELTEGLESYIASVADRGFLPGRLYFAIKRFQRWMKLNMDAATPARALMINEMYETYDIASLLPQYPEARSRLFADTVFCDARPELQVALEEIIKGQKEGRIDLVALQQTISSLQAKLHLNEGEEFFIARLTYPHLKPTDSAELISLETGGVSRVNLVVRLEDYEGNPFNVRTPVNPKEIARLHQLFISSKLPVQFRPEHRYLIAVNDRGQLIGGLFYRRHDDKDAHLEKIVVHEFYRKKGVSDALLKEFFNRLRARKISYVTTGFFRPEYFYRFGFKIEAKYAGLFKDLTEEEKDEE